MAGRFHQDLVIVSVEDLQLYAVLLSIWTGFLVLSMGKHHYQSPYFFEVIQHSVLFFYVFAGFLICCITLRKVVRCTPYTYDLLLLF